MNIKMLSIVLVFGIVNAVSGGTSVISSGSSSTVVERTTLVTSLVEPTATGFSFTTINVRYNSSVTSTIPVRASPTFWTSSAMKRQSSFEITNSSFSTARQASSLETHSLFLLMNKSFSTVTQSTSTRMESSFPVSNKIIPTSSGAHKTTLSKHATSRPTRTTATTTKDEVNVMGMKISIEELKIMFYGAAGLALVCIILLIVTCCCWRRQSRVRKKLQREGTTLSNAYVNNCVLSFPSPLQLETFVDKAESPYDTPENVEAVPEVSYVTVVNGVESESDYAVIKGNGQSNSVGGDSESPEDGPQPSPAYTNASVFEIEPYQELNRANRCDSEEHYTSLIGTNKDKEKGSAEMTV